MSLDADRGVSGSVSQNKCVGRGYVLALFVPRHALCLQQYLTIAVCVRGWELPLVALDCSWR